MYESSIEGVSAEDCDVELDVFVRGEEDMAEKVLIHARAEGVRAMRALRDDRHPDEVRSLPVEVAWDRVVGDSK